MFTQSTVGPTEPVLPTGWAYAPEPGGFDEALNSSGQLRPPFAEFFGAIRHLPPAELARRWMQAQKIIRDNGVTYNVYGDPRGTDRPWQLDPIPLLVDGAEWALLEAGLAQRGRLLDAILADLYGPQRILSMGLLPAELVLGNPAFLRPLHGVPAGDGVRLHLYAADLARGSDGRFWVIGDRTQAPSGAGYTLENRIVISRMLPQAFRDCRVERLAPFFRTVRDGLARLSRNRDNPRVVLLTPGPYNETYFEHAYLARYLGYTLAEGGDLTVRDRSVHLKTLGGLERVDVILRRLDDSYSDPLTLRPDSSLGIPGLVHAVRAGSIAVANGLGSGLVEMPALMGFLPELCRALLGEELRVPSVPSWFCGHEASLTRVLEKLPELVIKSARLGPGAREPVFGGDLSQTELSQLRAEIRARPSEWVAQERLPLSTSPTYGPDGLQPRHLSLRAFLARRGGDYHVMPGGLTRFASSHDSLVVSMQRGGGSKDTWVLSSGEPSNLTLLHPPGLRVEIVRSGADLPSRAADHLFWIGRHVERADGTTRLIRSLLSRRAEDTEGRAPEVAALQMALEDNLELLRGSLARAAGPDAELARVLIADEPSRTPRSGIQHAYRAASVVRDRISVDTWHVLSHLNAEIDRATRRSSLELSDALELSGALLHGFSAFSGLVMENMTHGPGWRFADIGRRIERGTFMVKLLRGILVSANDAGILDAALEVADSAITYRSRYLGSLAIEPVLDLLITDETNPRSIAFQLAALEDHVGRLPRAGRTPLLAPEAKTVLRALSQVRFADLDQLARPDALGRRGRLDELLGEIEAALPELADQLTLNYLAHARPSIFVGSST